MTYYGKRLSEEEQNVVIANMVEVELPEPDNFRIIRESLTRIGIVQIYEDQKGKQKDLIQQCHIFHKRGKYYVAHYKFLQQLDGKAVGVTNMEKWRQNRIAWLLEHWGFCKIVGELGPMVPTHLLEIVKTHQKQNYNFVSHHRISKHKLF